MVVTLLTTVLSSPATTSANSTTPIAHEMLEKYDFPRAILPKGVKGYTLGPNGSFVVYLSGDCSIHVNNVQIIYNSSISGKIQNRRIHDLKGVGVNLFFLWIFVDQVDRIDNQIQFHSNWHSKSVSKSFLVSQFTNSPVCERAFTMSMQYV
ncbi:hypothetical protein PR202_ga11232 [Eleusine coracana subsp. coracana]|uniref:Uncharacterized protein n=1 Tax=Eleusine coracana subsp. coracana TaxID=191504 RepID=A0AAV5C8U5_ELECO|nr:hypothetical protein PR202_ga11227 [Eleusine coracana subsp. coracana]GJM94575.1 hypothetical protein PR202_ga11232 [Eleusine coracana subsp. coracana]